MNEISKRAEELFAPILNENGYEIVEIRFDKQFGEDTLTVFVYKKGGITLEDCEKINELLDPVLDENDLTDGKPYTFNVSSPGLDRPVVTDDDFRRSLDTELEVIFLKPKGKALKASGTLVAYDDESLTLVSKDNTTVYKRSDIQTVRPYIKF